jgi:hypothetical protein
MDPSVIAIARRLAAFRAAGKPYDAEVRLLKPYPALVKHLTTALCPNLALLEQLTDARTDAQAGQRILDAHYRPS